ncbi:hypothetical protein [Paenarthrobacter ureafaciens]|uniref:hypothetical protein n=1 Tax=Paenarthrobacter ureafaciens TaxID=37931 RepID=UPI001FB4BD05|nr:hypothetical protein [Paenarthrobacter ureafaciens]UOD83477.1 hypothetical protein MQZ73_20790 [Paenarthrobacter ureafaciens]
MSLDIPDLLTGTEMCLVAEVPGAGGRWQQVHFNLDIARQFFGLQRGDGRSITLERIAPNGRIVERSSRQLVLPESNGNARIEFSFGSASQYPAAGRPLVVVVESGYLTYRYRTLMPGNPGHDLLLDLLSAGPSIGRGLRRRIVTLDDLELYWPYSALRGGV